MLIVDDRQEVSQRFARSPAKQALGRTAPFQDDAQPVYLIAGGECQTPEQFELFVADACLWCRRHQQFAYR